MAATSTTENWDAAWTLTARSKRKRLSDNISDSYPTIGRFRKSGIVEVESGGKEIQEDLMYALNASEWFDGYDNLNTDAVDGITAAFYLFRYNATPVTISMTEEQENKKSDKAVKLITAKLSPEHDHLVRYHERRVARRTGWQVHYWLAGHLRDFNWNHVGRD